MLSCKKKKKTDKIKLSTGGLTVRSKRKRTVRNKYICAQDKLTVNAIISNVDTDAVTTQSFNSVRNFDEIEILTVRTGKSKNHNSCMVSMATFHFSTSE